MGDFEPAPGSHNSERAQMTLRNGLYCLHATARDGSSDGVGGVLMLSDGKLLGGDAFVFYTGTYESSNGYWQGKMTSEEHTPTTRPISARVQQIGFIGTYSDTGAKVDAMALVGEHSVRYDATLRLLLAT